MKYIKTYEIFKNFSFLRKKKDPFSTPDLKDIVEDSLIDLSDLGFTIVVDIEMNRVRDNVGNPISSDPSVKIKIHKKENSVDYNEFNVSEILETLRFALPFLQKEYGLELYDISYNEMGWTYSRNKLYFNNLRIIRIFFLRHSFVTNISSWITNNSGFPDHVIKRMMSVSMCPQFNLWTI